MLVFAPADKVVKGKIFIVSNLSPSLVVTIILELIVFEPFWTLKSEEELLVTSNVITAEEVLVKSFTSVSMSSKSSFNLTLVKFNYL